MLTIRSVTSTTTPSLPTLARTASNAGSPSRYDATVPLASTTVTAVVCDERDPCRRLDPCVAVATAPATVWSMNQGNAGTVYPCCVPRNSASPNDIIGGAPGGPSSSRVRSSWLARWSKSSLSVTPASALTVMDSVSTATRSATGLRPAAPPLPASRRPRSLGDAPTPTLRRRWVRTLTLSSSSPEQKRPRCQLCPTPFALTRGNRVTTSETSSAVRGAAMRTLASHACLPWKLLRSWPEVPSSPAARRSSVQSNANMRGRLCPWACDKLGRREVYAAASRSGAGTDWTSSSCSSSSSWSSSLTQYAMYGDIQGSVPMVMARSPRFFGDEGLKREQNVVERTRRKTLRSLDSRRARTGGALVAEIWCRDNWTKTARIGRTFHYPNAPLPPPSLQPNDSRDPHSPRLRQFDPPHRQVNRCQK